MSEFLRLIRPIAITDAILTSNIAETGSEYASNATYAAGDVVIATADDGFKHSYESLVDANVGNALTDETRWLDLGPTNRWAMFDDVVGTTTTGAAGIDVSIAVSGRVDGLALFNLDATSVQVTMTTSAGTVYNETFDLLSDTFITDWFAYFSEEVTYSTELVLTELPLYGDPVVRVQIANTLDVSSCGLFKLGFGRDIGAPLYGASSGIADFSRKETDEFGNTRLIERSYAKRSRFEIVTDSNQVDAIYDLLASFRATPVVWVGAEDFRMTWGFGWPKSWDASLVFVNKSKISLEMEGLI